MILVPIVLGLGTALGLGGALLGTGPKVASQGPSGGTGGPTYVKLTDVLSLRPRTVYRGRMRVEKTPLTPEELGETLKTVGFDEVQVWTNASTLPADWTEETRSDDAPNVFFFQGRWTGDKPPLARPPALEKLWYAPVAITKALMNKPIASGDLVGAVMRGEIEVGCG